MKIFKKRIAIFLCMLMAITAVAAYIPATQETAKAATQYNYYMWGNYGFSSYYTKLSEVQEVLVVAKGTSDLYVRDFVFTERYSDNGECKSFSGKEMKDAKYVSKNPDIVSINEKTGKIKAKKKGTALIKVKWKGQQLCGAIKVVDASDMKTYQKENKALISAAKKLIKLYDGKITAKNAVKVLKQKVEMDNKSYYNYVAYQSCYNDDGYYDHGEYYLYSMDTYKASNIINEMYAFFSDLNPFATISSNCFKISSISGKGKDVTATLSKAVTDKQMMGAQYSYVWQDSSVLGGKDLSFNIYVRDTKSNDIFSAIATIKTGSKDMKIKCTDSLTSGRKYELIQYDWYDEMYENQNWIHMGKSTFTAK